MRMSSRTSSTTSRFAKRRLLRGHGAAGGPHRAGRARARRPTRSPAHSSWRETTTSPISRGSTPSGWSSARREKFGSLDEPATDRRALCDERRRRQPEMLVGLTRRTTAAWAPRSSRRRATTRSRRSWSTTCQPTTRTSVLISAQPYLRRIRIHTRRAHGHVQRRACARGAARQYVTREVHHRQSGRRAFRRGLGFRQHPQAVLPHRRRRRVGPDQHREGQGCSRTPIGFSADNKIAYLQVEQPKGPDAIVALDLATKKRTEVLRDDDADPGRIIYRNGTRIPVGAYFMDGKPRTAFFDANAPEARLQRSLEAAFGGDARRHHLADQRMAGWRLVRGLQRSQSRRLLSLRYGGQEGRTRNGPPAVVRP